MGSHPRKPFIAISPKQCCQLWLFVAKWAIFRPCDLAIFGKNVGYSQLFGLFLGKVWLFRLF